jgi:hypothetical protein
MKKYLIFSLLFLVVIISGCSNKKTEESNFVDDYVAPVNSQEEVVATTTPTQEDIVLEATTTDKIYTDTEKQIYINFVDGYEKYNNDMILFGPLKNVVESKVDDNRQIHIYQLGAVSYKSSKEIIKNYNISSTTTVKPTIIKIGNFEVVKYAEGGMCEERTLEVIGTKYNYRFSADGCHNSQEIDFNYLTETIKQLRVLE